MRQSISMFLAIFLMFASFSISVPAARADADLIFELAITGENGAATQANVSNTVEGNDSVLGIKGTPMIGEFHGAAGTKKYLSFGDNVLDAVPADNQLNRAMVSVEDTNFINKDALTFEAWLKPKSVTTSVYQHPFALPSPLTTTDYSGFEIFTVGNSWRMRVGGSYKGIENSVDMTGYCGNWTHIVVTRQWSNDRWTSYTYVNGVQVPGFNIVNAQPNPAGRRDETGYILGIGNGNQHNGLRAFKGDIATFKVFNKILTPSEALANYNATLLDFTPCPETMEIESVTPAKGLLNPAGGQIIINFNDFVDKDTLSGIAFTKSGDSVNIGVVKTDAGATKIVRVEFPALDKVASYVLTIPATVKSVNNNAVESAVYHFSAWTDALVFELDISGTSGIATVKDVSDAVSGSSSDMEILGTLMLGSFQSYVGETKYISIGNSEITAVDGEKDPLNRSAILVQNDDFLGQNEMTIETWMKPKWMSNAVNGYGINYPFSLSNGIINASSFETMIFGDSFYVRPGGASGPVTLTNMSAYNDGWMHVAITRKWNNPGSTSGTWSYETFVNGNKIDALSTTTASTTRLAETDHFLAIGHSSWNGDNDSRRTRSFRGDVAMFKVYNKLLTPADVLKNYHDTEGNFAISSDKEMEIVSVTPEGGKITTKAGKFVIEFSDYVDLDSLSGITLKKADGSAVKGVVFVDTASKFSKTVMVNHGTLEDRAEYILTIDTTVKSLGGKFVQQTKHYEFDAEKMGVGGAPEVLYTNLNGLSYSDNIIDIIFDNDMAESSFNATRFALRGADDKKIPTEFIGYNSSIRRAQIKLLERLDFNAEYTLTVGGMSDKQGGVLKQRDITFKIKDYEATVEKLYFTNGDNQQINQIQGSAEVKANAKLVNNSSDWKTCAVITVAADESGRIVFIKDVREDIAPKGNAIITAGVSAAGFTNGYTLKAYVWDITLNGFLPVIFNPLNIGY
ncbi:MAG: LamG domain-containing protein [Firmicutes bacterium]|nr:LamG domain-containing protein [Bacillota bacterium]